MSRNALKFITIYTIAVILFIILLATCTSCSSVKKVVSKKENQSDSIATTTKKNTSVHNIDSTFKTEKENDWTRYMLELPPQISSKTAAYTIDIADKKITLPAGSKLILEKQKSIETTATTKKIIDSALNNEQSSIKKTNASKIASSETKKQKFLPGMQYILFVILILLLIAYIRKRFLKNILP